MIFVEQPIVHHFKWHTILHEGVIDAVLMIAYILLPRFSAIIAFRILRVDDSHTCNGSSVSEVTFSAVMHLVYFIYCVEPPFVVQDGRKFYEARFHACCRTFRHPDS